MTWLVRHLRRSCLSLPCRTSCCHGIFQSHLLISQLHLRLVLSPAPHLWQPQLKCSLDSFPHCQIVFGSMGACPTHFLKLGLTHLCFDLQSSCLTRWTLQPSVLDYSFACWCFGLNLQYNLFFLMFHSGFRPNGLVSCLYSAGNGR